MWPGAVVTKFSQAGPFWEAEAEDQDYLQRYSDGNNQFSPYRSVQPVSILCAIADVDGEEPP